MKSEVYKQAIQTLAEESRPPESEMWEDEDVHSRYENSEADDEDTYNFHMRESLGRRNDQSQACCASVVEKEGRREMHRKGCLPNKIKWADECKKELTRQNPRKKYTKRPSQNPPLKSILKGN